MFSLTHRQRRSQFWELGLRSIVSILISSLVFSPSITYAQQVSVLGLPKPGAMVDLSSSYAPVIVKGLHIHPENPILFDFIVDTGDSGFTVNSTRLRSESMKLIKYFLASLTIPENDLWVNLSPYEKDRIIPEQLGQTVMGRDMLAQDYILKQLTASLIYPEKNLGKEFWNRVYTKAHDLYGSSEVPVNTFNKVWIVADKAKVYVHHNTAFVVACHMKVMLEQDYLAMYRHGQAASTHPTNVIGSQIVREVVLPELEKEVNQGKNFANLRQIFNSMILAAWYKKSLKEALLNQVYSNKAKINGIDVRDKTIKEQIYQEYLKAYKKGVFNYIKEDVQANGQAIPRKYFSGGIVGSLQDLQEVGPNDPDEQNFVRHPGNLVDVEDVQTPNSPLLNRSIDTDEDAPFADVDSDRAMVARGTKLEQILFSSYIGEINNPQREIGVVLKQQAPKFEEAKENAVSWVNNNLPADQKRPVIVSKVVVIEDQKRPSILDKIKIDRIKNEMSGFYFQKETGILYVLRSFLEEGMKNAEDIKSTDILSAQIVMAFQNPKPLDAPDALYEQKIEELSIDEEGNYSEESKRELLSELIQRRHKENLVRAYEYAFRYLRSRNGTAQEARDIEKQLQVEKKRFMGYLPGSYSKEGLEEYLQSKGVAVTLMEEGEAEPKDLVFYKALTEEVGTLVSYCGYLRALNIMARKINPKNSINRTKEELDSLNRSKGKEIRTLVWASALNPETVAHLLIALEQMTQTDSGYELLTEGDFRKLALLHSAPLRRDMVGATHRDIFDGNQLTGLGVIFEPEPQTKEQEKYRLNGEEKIREHVVKLNPGVAKGIIYYGLGVDHYRGINGWGLLDANNVRDFVYYMAMSDYIPLLDRLSAYSLNGDVEMIKELVKSIVGEERNFDQRRELLLKNLSARIKNGEEIRVPLLDSIPKLALIKKELKDEKRPFDIRVVVALRGGESISADPLRDEIIKDYDLDVTINDGLTSKISSTDIRKVLEEYALTGKVNQFKLGSLLLSEWGYIFGSTDESINYRNFLTRYGSVTLPASLHILEAKRAPRSNENIDPEGRTALQNELNADADLRKSYQYEVGVSQITLDKHTAFNITAIRPPSPDQESENAEINVNYSVKCSLNKADGKDITTFNNFGITFINASFLTPKQKTRIKDKIVTHIRSVNGVTGSFNVIVTDAAMNASSKKNERSRHVEGGIDLNARNLQLVVDGETIDIKFDPAMVEQFQRRDFSGVVPSIVQITPIQDPLSLLGVDLGKEEAVLH